MSNGDTVQSTAVESRPGLRTSWRALAVGGGLIALLGVLAMLLPLITGLAVSIVFGGLLVVGGVVHVAHAFSAQAWDGFVWQVLLAVVYTFAGITLLANPVVGLTTLTILLIVYFLVAGVVELGIGLQLREGANWAWAVGSGVVSILLAVLLAIGFPATAVWAVGLLFGINLLATGLSMILLAMDARTATDAPGVDAAG